MNKTMYIITIPDLVIAMVPLVAVMLVYLYWKIQVKTFLYAVSRMLLQLVAIGFVLNYIFKTKEVILIAMILLIMLVIASWIALRPLGSNRKIMFYKACISIAIAGLPILALIIFAIIRPSPWFEPTYLLPLAGMIFANSMNALSVGAERFFNELNNNKTYFEARNIALKTALIPVTNMFFAVGLVSLPGMMTGQILAGVSPLIAVRYQILIMSTLFGAAGLSTAIFLFLSRFPVVKKQAF